MKKITYLLLPSQTILLVGDIISGWLISDYTLVAVTVTPVGYIYVTDQNAGT